MNAVSIVRVRPTRGAGWVRDGFRLFRKNPLILIVLTMLVLLLALALSIVPYIGAYLLYLLTPIFLAGMMSACRDVDAGEEIEIYRRSVPYGTASEHGLYFVAFSADPDRVRAVILLVPEQKP